MIRAILLSIGLLVTVSCTEERIPLTVKVVNDEGAPIAELPVAVSYNERSVSGGMFGRLVSDTETIQTDEDGLANILVPVSTLHKNTVINTGHKRGFYSDTSWDYNRGYIKKLSADRTVLDIVIPRVIQPVSPYAVSNWEWKFPNEVGPWGFDFFAADWVAPYGRGEHADIQIELTDDNSNMQWNFTDEESGIILLKQGNFGKSPLRSPYEGPSIGYLKEFVIKNQVLLDENASLRMRTWCYLIRIQRPGFDLPFYGKSNDAIYFQYLEYHSRGVFRWSYGFNPEAGNRWIEFNPNESASAQKLEDIWGETLPKYKTTTGP